MVKQQLWFTNQSIDITVSDTYKSDMISPANTKKFNCLTRALYDVYMYKVLAIYQFYFEKT